MKRIFSFVLVLVCIVVLTACGKYTVDVDLTLDEIQEVKAEIQLIKEEINNYVSENGEIAWREYIKLSKAYEKLGDMSSAIKVYTDLLNTGKQTKAIINNLGRLYEDVGEYDLAIEQYQKIIRDYIDPAYLYDITWAYIRAKNRKEAEKYFNAWQLEFQKTDTQTQQAIKKLREEEKNV